MAAQTVFVFVAAFALWLVVSVVVGVVIGRLLAFGARPNLQSPPESQSVPARRRQRRRSPP